MYHGATCMKKNAAKTFWNDSITLAVKTENPVSKLPSLHAEDGVPLMSPVQSWTDLNFYPRSCWPRHLEISGCHHIQPWQESAQCFFFHLPKLVIFISLIKIPFRKQLFHITLNDVKAWAKILWALRCSESGSTVTFDTLYSQHLHSLAVKLKSPLSSNLPSPLCQLFTQGMEDCWALRGL